jgi:hypothetical protein
MSESGEDVYPPVVPAPGSDARAPGVTRDIYGMPAFVSFAVRDIEAARDWYTRGLDFIDAPAATAAARSRGPPTPPGTPATSTPATPTATWTSSPPPAPPRDTDPAFTARIRDLADQQLG